MSPYEVGSKLEVPGLEAVIEYGSITALKFDRILGSYKINDRSRLERAHLSSITGLHDEPDGRDTRENRSDTHGERAGRMFYGGRTVGLTGKVEAGSISRMRDEWRRFRGQFGTSERDLLVHSPSEVRSYTNEILNPRIAYNTTGWRADQQPGGTSSGVTNVNEATYFDVGQVTATGITAAGYVGMRYWDPNDFNKFFVPYSGEDVFIGALVRVKAASGGTITGIRLGPFQHWVNNATPDPTMTVVQATPVTGTWYWVTLRVPAISIDTQTNSVSMMVDIAASAAGTYTIQVTRAMMCLIAASDPSPPGFFDGYLEGYEWDGVVGASRSRGPCYAVNSVWDPFVPSNVDWPPITSSGVTASSPVGTKRWHVVAPRSLYSSAGSSTGAGKVISIRSGSSKFKEVVAGRKYKFYARVRVEHTDVPFFDAVLVWQDFLNVTISTTAVSYAVPSDGTEIDVVVEGTAPNNAIYLAVQLGLVTHTTTGAGQGISFYLGDPCLTETTHWDPGRFVGSEDPAIGVYNPINSASSNWTAGLQGWDNGSMRLIPRPWLIRGTRMTSDAKAPEQQSDARAWRDFTMSLRASDPRIYVLDERRRQAQMVGTPQLVTRQAPADFTLESATLPVPSGYTYEGHFITNPGGSPFLWSHDAYNWPIALGAPLYLPNSGVGIKVWNASGLTGSNRPTSDLVTRVYRSAEGSGGYTYTKPRVVLGCAPAGYGFTTDRDFVWQAKSGGGINANYAGILLKRVSSGTWVELRWKSVSNAATQFSQPGNTFHYAFELWSSHDTAGTAAVTRLATWDYASYDSTSGVFPFRPQADPMWLVATMDAGSNIKWELWTSYPSLIDFSARIESGTYALSASLTTLMGAAVAGQAGWTLSIPRGASQAEFLNISSAPPFMHYFESSKNDVLPGTMTIPVIGDIDTPQRIQLRGDLVDPIVSVTVPAFDDLPATTSVARFSGTILESNPVTVDLGDDGSVVDAAGVNQHQLLLPGSDFATLRPGLNYVTVQAKNWGSYTAHVVTSWRDARK